MSIERFPGCEFFEDREGHKPATLYGCVGMAMTTDKRVAFIAVADDERPIWVGGDRLEFDDVNDDLVRVK